MQCKWKCDNANAQDLFYGLSFLSTEQLGSAADYLGVEME